VVGLQGQKPNDAAREGRLISAERGAGISGSAVVGMEQLRASPSGAQTKAVTRGAFRSRKLR